MKNIANLYKIHRRRKMKFNFEKNLQQRLAKPEYNTDINIDEVLQKVEYPTTPPSLEDLKKYIHIFCEETLPMEAILTQRQMLEDFNQFKFLIQYVYSGYKVIGEKFFENAFHKLSAFIESHQTATKEEFAKEIYLSLEGLEDNHFSITPYKGVCFRPLAIRGRLKTYINSKYNITKSDKDFFMSDRKIVSINGNHNIGRFIKVVCGVDGKLKLGFVVREIQNTVGENIILNIDFENKDTLSATLNLKKFEPLQHHNNGFVKKLENCIYIRNTACELRTQKQQEELDGFCKIIEKNINDIDFTIIDARSNRGGADMFNSAIHKAILNMESFKQNIGLFHLCAKQFWNETNKKSDTEYAKSIYENYQESIKSGTPNIKEITLRKQENSPHNNKIIFVLTDERSTSSGEQYNTQLRAFQNVVFLNDNTAGMMHFGNLTSYYLGHSKIKLKLANSHLLFGNYLVENKGFPPDVYFDCDASEILTTLQNFINQNTTLKCPPLTSLQKYEHKPLEENKYK